MRGAAIERRQSGKQRRAGDARLRVGLHDLGDRRGDIEIGGARLFDQLGQFLGAEAAPPVERRHGCFRQRGVLRAALIGLRNIERRVGLVAAEQTAAEGQHQAESLQHGHNQARAPFCSRPHSLTIPTHNDDFRNN